MSGGGLYEIPTTGPRDVVELLLQALRTGIPEATAVVDLGREKKALHGKNSGAVVMYPTTERFDGGRPTEEQSGPPKTRRRTVRVELSAEDYAATNALVDVVVVAITKHFASDFRILTATWYSEPSVANRGEAYAMDLELSSNVIDRDSDVTTVVIGSTSSTYAFTDTIPAAPWSPRPPR